MGLEAIYPKPRLSRPGRDHKIYPYLFKGVKVDKRGHVWCADITYIRLVHGFLYLVVILDWASRYGLSSELSMTLDKRFCLAAARQALVISKPEIFNTDQGPQLTSEEFTGLLKEEGIRVSPDGRHGVYDNIILLSVSGGRLNMGTSIFTNIAQSRRRRASFCLFSVL